jgi:outer membrane protein assembly factor BamB
MYRAIAAMLFGAALLSPVLVRADPPAEGQKADPNLADEQTLRKVGLPTDTAALLTYFRKRTFAEPNPERLASLIEALNSESFPEREKAHAELLQMGSSVLPLLRKMTFTAAETSRRVRDVRQRIEEKADPQVQAASARLLGRRKAPEAAEVLFKYLPFALDESLIEEIGDALASVAVNNGKPEAVLVQGLKDKLPLKRAMAGQALLRAGALEELDNVRALLKDADAAVRLRVGLSVVNVPQRATAWEGVATLISLLGELPQQQLWTAEDVLVRLAGEQPPSISLGTDEASRKKARDAWSDWWMKNREKADFTLLKKTEPYLGLTILVQHAHRFDGRIARQVAEVMEVDAAKEVKWKFEVKDNGYPVDVRVIGKDRLLLTEYNGRRLTERDFKGNVTWQHNINEGFPMSAQRLRNGNTFVATQNRLLEIDKAGKEVWVYRRPNNNHDIFRAQKARNGDVIFITNQGTLVRMNPQNQQQLASFNVGPIGSMWGNMDVLPNGNILVPVQGAHRVVEFDPNGKEVWQAQVQMPIGATRLPNGNTLVYSMNTRQIQELDRSGREVWSHLVDGQTLMQARRR